MERHNHPAVACFYADGMPEVGATVTLGDRVAHHAIVRRIEQGDVVVITNGVGAIGRGRVARLAKREMDVSIEGVEHVAAPTSLRLGAPIADRERMLWAAEKSTELGITSWQSVRFRRSMSVSPRGEGPSFGEKLRARMIGAVEQSFGGWLPRILPDEPPSNVETADDLKLVLDSHGEPILDALSSLHAGVALLVGPEGGIEIEERERLVADGWRPVSLGSSTLRFETAAVAAVAIIRAVHASDPSFGASSRAQ